MPKLGIRTIARTICFIASAVALAATAIHHRDGDFSSGGRAMAVVASADDPLARQPSIQAAARAAGFVAVVLVLAATATRLRHGDAEHSGAAVLSPGDPLLRELDRCHAFGIAARDDMACGAAWAENRRHFFAPLSRRSPAINDADPIGETR